MNVLHRLIAFLIYSNTIIGLAAVGLVATVAQVSGTVKVDEVVLLFVFSLLVCSYSWLKYKMGSEIELPSTTHRQWFLANKFVAVFWLVANAMLMLGLFFQVIKQRPIAIGLLVLCSIFYVIDFKYSIRRWALFKPFYVALIWVMLVILMVYGISLQWHVDVIFTAIAVFLLLAVLLLLFEIKDRKIDAENKLTTWPIRFGIKHTKLLAYGLSILLLLSSGISCLVFDELFVVSLAFAGQAVLLLPLVKFTTSESSDYWYFFVLDGSMLLLPLFYFQIG